jgi:DNA primase
LIDRGIIESIRDRVDIAEIVGQTVTLKRRGTSLVGLCPFHQEKTPSFSVVPHKGIFHCFGCGEGGDIFGFVMKTRGIEFIEAVKDLASSCGVTIEERQLTPDERRRMQARAGLHDVNEAACQWFQSVLLTRPEGKIARDYLVGRGLTEDTVSAFRLGYALPTWDALQNHLHAQGYASELVVAAGLGRQRADSGQGRSAYDLFRGRLMVPIMDTRGRVAAFGGRVLDGVVGPGDAVRSDAPKYVNSPETDIYKKSRVLYGLHQARRAIQLKDRVLVVEGYFDVLSLHQAGFEEAVATCGTALTPGHMKVIRPLTRTAVAVFDADTAGVRAAVRSMPLFVVAGIEVKRLDLGESKDPDEFVQVQGAEAFEARLGTAEPLLELVLRDARASHGSSPEGRQRTVEQLAPLLREYPGPARSAVVARVSSTLGLREDVVSQWIGRAREVPSVGPAAPARWRGTKELNHLFWLLLHHPDMVSTVISSADPDIVTDYAPARQAFALLMKGKSLPEVLDSVGDNDLSRVLRAAAARVGLYEAEKAENAAYQILDRLEIRNIDTALTDLEREIATCAIADDTSSYFSLVRARQALQKRKDAIKTRFAR